MAQSPPMQIVSSNCRTSVAQPGTGARSEVSPNLDSYLRSRFANIKRANLTLWDKAIETVRQIKLVADELRLTGARDVTTEGGIVNALTIASWLGMGDSVSRNSRQKVQELWSTYCYMKAHSQHVGPTVRTGGKLSDQGLLQVLHELFEDREADTDLLPSSPSRYSQQWNALLKVVGGYRLHLEQTFGTTIADAPGAWNL